MLSVIAYMQRPSLARADFHLYVNDETGTYAAIEEHDNGDADVLLATYDEDEESES